MKNTKKEIIESIKWDIDHDYSYGYYILSGDFNKQRFTQIVYDGFWGIPLRYKKWCIERRYLILYKK